MIVFDFQTYCVIPCLHFYDKVQDYRGVQKFYVAYLFVQKFTTSLSFKFIYIRKNFHVQGCVSSYCTENYTCFNSSQSAGVRNDNTTDIFYNVSTAFCSDMFRFFSQNFSCSGCSICQRDRFCTSHCRNHFFFQNAYVILIYSLI